MNTARLLLLCAACLLVCAGRASAQLEIPWFTMDGGGGVSTGGGFTLNGTVAQTADVGQTNFGGPAAFYGGYWSGGTIAAACPVDFNADGVVTVQDIYDFLTAWNAFQPAADFNLVNYVTVQDIYDYLYAWTVGCP